MWMLDTNICSYIIREHPISASRTFASYAAGQLFISTVVLAELYFGAAKHPRNQVIREQIDKFTNQLSILDWDQHAADDYGRLRTHLESKGRSIGNLDIMIAAHARSLDAILVTNNTKHFSMVPGLKLENWI